MSLPPAASRSLPLVLSVLLTQATPVPAQEAPWPTDGWTVSDPAAQGLDAMPLEALDAEIRAGAYGYIDRMVVVKDGYLVMSERYPTDYYDISRGVTGPLGCGTDACDDEAQVHPYNYLHPDFHPWYQGRDVHSLQSVTKSVKSRFTQAAGLRCWAGSAHVSL